MGAGTSHRRTHQPWILAILLLTLVATSCGVDKYLQPDESVLYRNKIKVEQTDGENLSPEIKAISNNLSPYLRQSPNKKTLGLMRIPMRFYCLSNPNKENGWNNWLRREGQAPEIYNPEASNQSRLQLERYFAGKGCFHSTVTTDTLDLSGRDISICYTVKASPRYRIDDVIYHIDDADVSALLKQTESAALVKKGDFYDQEILTNERERIATLLQDNGYYKASREMIRFVVDTTYAAGLLSIDIYISGHPEKYFIQRIDIDSNKVREEVIRRVLTLSIGQVYKPKNISDSYNALLGLRNFKLINIDLLEDTAQTQARLLNAHIQLQNKQQQQVSLSFELSNASPISRTSDGNWFNSGNFGISTVLGYQHANIFGGAELFSANTHLMVEIPKVIFQKKVQSFSDIFQAFEAGLNLTLDLPTFLFPFSNAFFRPNRTHPHTLLNIEGDYQYRSYMERIKVGTGFGYTWIPSNHSQHKLFPFEISYVRFFNLDIEYIFRNLIDRNFYRTIDIYSDHLILDARYEYTYSDQIFGKRINFNYFNASIESAGNLLAAICTSIDDCYDPSNKSYRLFDVTYSQYIRFTSEYKRYIYHFNDNTLVLRAMIGIGLPYGNSSSMPYEKSFYASGPTTIRAWQLRQLGPGAYPTHELEGNFDQVSDISLVFNIEERIPIAGIFEGAVFCDMGNVWASPKTTPSKFGGFAWDRFLSEIAIGAGLGLRLKISILTIRFDFAIPVYDPSYAGSERWRPKHWRFGDIVTNIGFDYPF